MFYYLNMNKFIHTDSKSPSNKSKASVSIWLYSDSS